MTTTSLKIKEMAERSGVTPATLRYYEEIGLLPPAIRTAAGYRLYDDRTLERLAFVNRAKQLGCSLEEIGELTTAWDGGKCSPVQDRLRTLVLAKIDEARRKIAELTALANDLERVATELDGHRAEGPCDDSCGCITSEMSIDISTSVGLKADRARPKART
ncbi:MAG: MerR family transcriptional regulator [Acidimicrobiia bacterium]